MWVVDLSGASLDPITVCRVMTVAASKHWTRAGDHVITLFLSEPLLVVRFLACLFLKLDLQQG
jgi:hypothetical protein